MKIQLIFGLLLLLTAVFAEGFEPLHNTVEVIGNGRASGQPDIATFNVEITESASATSNTKEATLKLNAKVAQVLTILAANGVFKTDVRTNQINVYPGYDYTDGKSVLSGYKASQTLTAKVRNLARDGSNVASLVDALAIVDGITVNNLVFDIENKKALIETAQTLAFNDAKSRATLFANLSGKKLGGVHTVADHVNGQENVAVPAYRAVAMSASIVGGAQVPVGETEVTAVAHVEFFLE